MDSKGVIDLSELRRDRQTSSVAKQLERASRAPYATEDVYAHMLGVADAPSGGRMLVLVRPDGRQERIHLRPALAKSIGEELLAEPDEDTAAEPDEETSETTK